MLNLLTQRATVKTLVTVLVSLLMLFAFKGAYAEMPLADKAAPAFELPDQNQQMHRLVDYSGHWVVLYFYPKDDTPGCTEEACSFRDDLFKLERLGAKVIGISVDSTDSHANFAKKYHLPFPLLSDNDGTTAKRYGALKTSKGTIRAKRYTYLINPMGVISKIYTQVDTSRHSQEIIDDLTQLTR